MPRPKKETAGEPKKRSRTGCWPCKARKVKCGEEKPACSNCGKTGEVCDYSIKLNWGGRSKRDQDGAPTEPGSFTFVTSPNAASLSKTERNGREHVFSAQHIATAPRRPLSREASSLSTPGSTPGGEGTPLDPQLYLTPRHSYQHERRPPALGGLPHPLPFDRAFQDSPGSAERSPPTSAPLGEEFRWSPQHSAKRARLSPTRSTPHPQLSPTRSTPHPQLSPNRSTPHPQPSPVFAVPQYPAQLEQSPASTHFTPHSISSIVNTPATPGSSIHSGSSPYPPQPATLQVQEPPDLRRLSVKSLLSDPSEESEKERPRSPRSESRYRTYGYDHGLQDLDIPHNDDTRILLPQSPDMRRPSAAVSEVSTSSNSEPDAKLIAFEPGGYYARPVPIKIPRFLEPLPDELLRNQMNLLYFHHFINHTGRIMVPHDCPENPFRGVLPQMAVRNTHLLHLVLAFSASHRARLLDHPEPANRIAHWMSDVLPALRRALSDPTTPGAGPPDPHDPSSLAPLATAIMLASLEIISPNTFAVPIPWQHHLHIARQIIVAKGGLHHLAQQADGARDKAIFFLSRWFAYLDVLGSLSGSRHAVPLNGAYLEDGGGAWLVNRSDEEIYQIDCFFGFSGRCIALLAQVAELAGECDRWRIDPVTRTARAGWQPPERQRVRALELQRRLMASATTVYRGCTHADPADPHRGIAAEHKSAGDVAEIFATNEAYHWAGLLHLSRRVLNLPSASPEIQHSVHKILGCLAKIRRGSTAEGCLVFPMFSAGCEALGPEERGVFMDRLEAAEGWGMQHVGRARGLMGRVWETGGCWEGMVEGEFLG
ncbi:hypothetical protein LTR36_010873 [Oleoguttula mirabilis]|uniref:Zn(2)-C6 fungal-type domain-containing protein n=1 Tax=Oleoguttula mirabilis TaxID=1507867 RepID=A0AAV9J3S5_9PEZI|nr:hypothetical protein LTR36_010873 [Oleoguttula mirabilis]